MNNTVNFLKRISILFLTVLSIQLSAQNMHIIGDETIENTYPPNTQIFEYGWSSMLYTSEEAGEAKAITKIAFDQTTDYTGYWEYAVLENQKIYIKQIDASEFSTLDYEDPENSSNGYTLVYDGTIQFNLSWTEITLNTEFDYDGSSAIIVHWENHRGTTSPMVNVKFNASTVSTNVFKTIGADSNFPTSFGTYLFQRPNIAIIYNGDGPSTPVNPTPANNSFKGLVETDLEFFIGDNTSSFDVYFGTTNPPTQVLQSDVVVSGSGTYSINPSEIQGNLLEPHTKYYWKVIAKDAGNTSSSEVWNFLSQGVITDFPYFTSFEDQPINPTYADSIDWSWPTTGSANWGMIDYDAFSGVYSVACNALNENPMTYSLESPRIYLPDNQRVKFRWKMRNGDPINLDMFFEISTNGGETWTELYEFEPTGDMESFDQAIINLSVYAGNNVKLRWRYETLSGYITNLFILDDLAIETMPTTAIIEIDEPYIEFPSIAVGAETFLPIEVSNIGVLDLEITGSTLNAPYSFTTPEPIAPGNSALVYVNITGTTESTFNQNFEFTGDFLGNVPVVITGSVYPVTDFFYHNADLSTDLPEHWSVIRTSDPNDQYTNIEVNASADAYSAPNGIRMLKMNDISSPLMLISEGTSGFGTNTLSLYAKKNSDIYDCELQIGTTKDPLNSDAFNLVQSFDMDTEYQLLEISIPSTTDPYIAFKYVGGDYSAAIWLDDISWNEIGIYPPNCPNLTFPENNSLEVDIMMDLEFAWISSGGDPTGYNLSIGTNPDANNMLDNQDVGNVLSYVLGIAPDYGETIYWKVNAYNAYGESTGCEINSFTVMDNPMVTVPYFENFDALDALEEQMFPLGYSHENTNEDNFPWDVISDITTPGMAHSTPNAMHMLFSLNYMDDYLFTPPVYLTAGTNYDFSFWYRTMGDSWVPEPMEKLKVYYGTDNNSSSMTTMIYQNENLTNQEWAKQTVSFEVTTTGEYYFSFYGYSDPNQGILLVDDVAIDFSVSVTDITTKNISIYPNPATDFITINSKEEIDHIRVYSMNGNLVFEEPYKANQVNIETSSLTTGAYMLVLETKKETIRRKFIIK